MLSAASFTFIENFHKRRSKKGIKVKIVYTDLAKSIAQQISSLPRTKIKFASNQFLASCFVVMYKTKTLITVASKDDLTLFQIDNKGVTESFIAQFKLLWGQKAQTMYGASGIKMVCDAVIQENKDFYIIGANGMLLKNHMKIFNELEKQRVKTKIKRYHLAIEKTRGSLLNKLPNTEARYLPGHFDSPNVIWVFGNKVAQVLWETDIVILFDDARIADDYRKYFYLLWESAKE